MADIAWAAGLYEGEGHAYSHRRWPKSANVFRIDVTQKDHWVLERMRDLFGGTVYHSPSNICGTWQTSGARAKGVAYTFFSYLSPRRRTQIQAALTKVN